MGPAIVVAAYARPDSLKRVLASLAAARVPSGTTLVITIDHSPLTSVRAVADAFSWSHGEKIVISHPAHLGLRDHILRCGDLSQKYGAVILLEDDLFVSPEFYSYTLAALAAFGGDPAIGGISLYNHRFNETAQLAFRAIEDGADCYFMQLASSWGQCWTREQWRAFRNWYDQNRDEPVAAGLLPKDVAEWPKTSWKKFFIQYLIVTKRYFVFPRLSLTTNFADPGMHQKEPTTHLQVPLLMAPMEFRFRSLADSIAVYDSHCEILPAKLKQLTPALAPYDFDVNLYGCKDEKRLKSPYVLTAHATRAAAMRFGFALKPHELNVLQMIPGAEISLARVEDCLPGFTVTDMERMAYYFDVPQNLVADRERVADRADTPAGLLTRLSAQARP